MYSISSRGDVVLNEHAKELLFRIHCKQGALAYDSNGGTRPLGQCDVHDVKLVAGLWRVQNKFDCPVQLVRGKEFVLLDRINRTEKNEFEFYRAARVGRNCYGRFLINGVEQVVAKYETADETLWSYGDNIEKARAFMGICLIDKFRDLIHATAGKNKIK